MVWKFNRKTKRKGAGEMLVNKTGKDFSLKYNSKIKVIKPNEGADVRDFDVETKHVATIEKHLMNKYPNTFERKESVGGYGVEVKFVEEINSLKNKIEELNKELDLIKSSEKQAWEKHSEVSGELNTAITTVDSMRKEVDKYKFEKEEMEIEVENLRLAVSTGTK
jgi:uncharacterized coiled-coil DUF342 family protein